MGGPRWSPPAHGAAPAQAVHNSHEALFAEEKAAKAAAGEAGAQPFGGGSAAEPDDDGGMEGVPMSRVAGGARGRELFDAWLADFEAAGLAHTPLSAMSLLQARAACLPLHIRRGLARLQERAGGIDLRVAPCMR